jgi:glutamine amidotransferase
VAGSISSLFDKLRLWGGDSCGLFNIIVSNGQDVVATRHGFGGQCPSLYLGGGALGMGDSWVISSEPMSENGDWNAVPEHHIVSIKIGDAPIISAL